MKPVSTLQLHPFLLCLLCLFVAEVSRVCPDDLRCRGNKVMKPDLAVKPLQKQRFIRDGGKRVRSISQWTNAPGRWGFYGLGRCRRLNATTPASINSVSNTAAAMTSFRPGGAADPAAICS